ncbi:hypothetical protein LWI29_035167 [Acer saccharum]|uniref:Uncharacterized protein n=1 Tax=Acer saccharum TaxID=4024 RepID=A0AA39S5F6_ACESA|nr:hypothetical protein LWI29_035167 [Acer saccharum]
MQAIEAKCCLEPKKRRGSKNGGLVIKHAMKSRNKKIGDEGSWNLMVEVVKVIECQFCKKNGPLDGNLDSLSLDEEITKVIETRAALGFDFKGREEEYSHIIAQKEDEDNARPFRSVPFCSVPFRSVLFRSIPFRFLNEWLEDEELMKKDVKGWKDNRANGSRGFVLSSKIKAANLVIKRGIGTKKKDTATIQELEDKLDKVDKKAVSDD